MKCVKVKLKEAENVKLKLLKLNVLSKEYGVVRDENYVYFPVVEKVKGFDIIDKKLEKKNKLSFEDILREKLNDEEFSLVKKSYDVMGNIAILEIDKKLLGKKKVIANVLLKVNKNIKTVVRKIGGHEGSLRLQKYDFLAGKKNFETLHKENGIVLKLDIKKVYFSPRTANERLRVAKLVRDREDVLVMFSGISPYEITIAKHSGANEIYGIEMNKDACKYAKENLKLNHINKIKLFCGDVRKILPKLKKKFDRIVMPFPKYSINFLDLALKYLGKNGVVHFYFFSQEDKVKDVVGFIKKKAKIKVLNIVKFGQQSPRIYKFCIDFSVT